MFYICSWLMNNSLLTIKNNRKMKKIIFSVLALGLSMGVMAQEKVYNGSEPLRGVLKNGPKAESLVYPETFSSCASVDQPNMYFSDPANLLTGLSGTNGFGDEAYGQMYNGRSYQVKGIAAVMVNYPVDGTTVDQMAAVLYSAANGEVGEELARVTFETPDLPELVQGTEFELLQYNFSAPVTSSDFLCAIEVAPLTIAEDGETVIGNISFIGTTEINCASGSKSYSYSILDDAGNMGWGTILSFWGVDLDMMIFPIVEGNVSLSEAELNSLSYVYPNPAKNEVMLASSFSIERVEIVNMLGQVVYSSDVNANSIKVNTSDFATGNYVVKMFTENGMATKKLVVE